MVKRITIILALCCALTATLFSQSFDPDFQPFVTRPGDVEKLALMPDGRFVVAGSFSLANRVERTNIARFLADGSLDETFQPSLNFAISALAVQPDGKVLIGGRYLDEGAPEGITILRLNTNGSLDNSFQAGFAPDGSFADIAVENNGTILVGGSFTEFAGQAVQGVVRLSSGGALQNVIPLNTSGVVFVSSLLVQSSGRFAVGGTVNEQGYLSYHEYSGAPVAGFNFSITLP
ncbi:MAG: delta-60 repeat domain-containing protein, partial [Phaeodactylibacter sp.]|nr:delta-60 repeat domain-containing protein [Phaeodactylibacter sp.]